MNLVELTAKRMRELRLRHNLTQDECAELAGMDVKFYQRLEAGGKKQIWLETVERLAAVFRLEVWELLGPSLPKHTRLRGKVTPGNIHNKRLRRGPYHQSEHGV